MRYVLTLPMCVYWLSFWLLNGLDKFLNGENIGLLVWHGRNRQQQFDGYLERLNIDLSWCETLLNFAGYVELTVAVLFVFAILHIVLSIPSSDDCRNLWLEYSFVASIFVFIAFSAFDVVVGDRAELLEHGTYIGVLILSYMACQFERLNLFASSSEST